MQDVPVPLHKVQGHKVWELRKRDEEHRCVSLEVILKHRTEITATGPVWAVSFKVKTTLHETHTIQLYHLHPHNTHKVTAFLAACSNSSIILSGNEASLISHLFAFCHEPLISSLLD